MMYAQQYAAYAQQFAIYAQYCAQQGAIEEAIDLFLRGGRPAKAKQVVQARLHTHFSLYEEDAMFTRLHAWRRALRASHVLLPS